MRPVEIQCQTEVLLTKFYDAIVGLATSSEQARTLFAETGLQPGATLGLFAGPRC